MNKLVISILGLWLIAASAFAMPHKFKPDVSLKYCERKVDMALSDLKKRGGGCIRYDMMPKHILKGEKKWELSLASKDNWVAGFWPGILWYDYALTGKKSIKEQAERFTASLNYLSTQPAYDHDLGFLIFCSYGTAYRLTHNATYAKVICDTADTLATLFNPKVGTILSWPREVSNFGGAHNTIMDNMINLEMLFWAARHGGGKRLYDIAVSHATQTMNHQFRTDYGNYHVALYDMTDGHFIKGVTHQGFADNSMWARGQSWAIYGFTMVYRETKDEKFLTFAKNVADVYLKRLPSDYVPYWDFDAPDIPKAPRDVSAACVTASALLELSTFLSGNEGAKYREAAERMLKSLSTSRYQSRGANSAFLLHSTGHWPHHSEIDASIVYADYYYMEALIRLKRLQENKPILFE